MNESKTDPTTALATVEGHIHRFYQKRYYEGITTPPKMEGTTIGYWWSEFDRLIAQQKGA